MSLCFWSKKRNVSDQFLNRGFYRPMPVPSQSRRRATLTRVSPIIEGYEKAITEEVSSTLNGGHKNGTGPRYAELHTFLQAQALLLLKFLDSNLRKDSQDPEY